MPPTTTTTRRDPRLVLRRGSAAIEFADPRSGGTRVAGDLVSVNVAGLSFEIGGDAGLEPGQDLGEVVLRVGPCLLRGDLVIRDSHAVDTGRYEIGGLFYPCLQDEDRWMTLLAGVEAARPH